MTVTCRHPKIISQAHQYASSLTEQQHTAPSSKLLCPREVVLKVVPKVVQGFWFPPSNTSLFKMPSQQLSNMAVGVTQAVVDRVSTTLTTTLHQISFSRSIRDNVALSIQEKVRQGYTPGVLGRQLSCFTTEVLNTITIVAAGEICALFQPVPPQAPSVLDGETRNNNPTSEPDSPEVLPPCDVPLLPSPSPADAEEVPDLNESATWPRAVTQVWLSRNHLYLPLPMANKLKNVPQLKNIYFCLCRMQHSQIFAHCPMRSLCLQVSHLLSTQI